MDSLSPVLLHSQGNSSKNLQIQEPLFYHSPQDLGYFTVWFKDIDGIPENNRQRTYPLKDLEDVLKNLDPKQNSYITQAEFSEPSRKKIHFNRIWLNFLDIDNYKADKEPTLDDILDSCEKEDEMPSLIVASGGGYYPKWFFDKSVEKEDLPKWVVIQNALHDKFRHLGADAKALDVSRVLRIENTANNKYSPPRQCRVVWTNKDSHGNPVRYNWEEKYKRYQSSLPLPPKAQDRHRTTLDTKPVPSYSPFMQNYSPQEAIPFVFSAASLNWARLEDIRNLLKIRGWNKGCPEGFRDIFLFYAVCFLSWMVPHEELYEEIHELGKEFAPSLSQEQHYTYTSTAYEMAKAGMVWKFTNSKIIKELEITPWEETQMRTLISKGEKQRRRKIARGQGDMEEYNAKRAIRFQKNVATANNLWAQGMNIAEIARHMEIDRKHVQRLLRQGHIYC